MADKLFSPQDEFRLSYRVSSAITLAKGETPVYSCIAEVLPDPDLSCEEMMRVIVVVTDRRLHVINTRKTPIFYPYHQVGDHLASIDLEDIDSMRERGGEDGKALEISVGERGSIFILGLVEVSEVQGLKLFTGRKVSLEEFMDSLRDFR